MSRTCSSTQYAAVISWHMVMKWFESFPCKQYLAQILTLDWSRSLPSSWPTVGLRFPMGRVRPASDWLSREGGVAAVSCCDWFSTTCFVRWALGANWVCTPSTFLQRKWGGGRKRGKSSFDKHTTETGVEGTQYSLLLWHLCRKGLASKIQCKHNYSNRNKETQKSKCKRKIKNMWKSMCIPVLCALLRGLSEAL